mgnify:CR=1 FL=1
MNDNGVKVNKLNGKTRLNKTRLGKTSLIYKLATQIIVSGVDLRYLEFNFV